MVLVDWLVVALLNGGIVLYGLYLALGVQSSRDWFLAGRSLPWWLVGLSLYATAIDSSDLVADSGGTYVVGFRYLTTNWVGVVAGWFLAAHFIFLPMYRAGMYTNAEYLEARFGPAARVISVLVQVQYRTLVLGIIANTLFLTLKIVCRCEPVEAWSAVAAVAILATLYTAMGGLRSVAITDALQFVVMAAATLILWGLVWSRVGGWSGLQGRLAAVDENLPGELLHTGKDLVQNGIRTPAWLVAFGFIVVGASYSVVNHTQAMRMLAAKSEWHLKMSAVVAGVVMIALSFFNLSMGVLGRALHPQQELLPDGKQDAIYPLLVSEVGVPVLTGLIVAGILAAALSTFDSIGSTLSALLTRDLYARLLIRDRDDAHYLKVGRWLTPLIIGGSFLYVPFLQEGMLLFYLELTSAFVVPLLTLYLMGAFTRVHRRSGIWGVLAGAGYGALRLSAPWIASKTGRSPLPPLLLDTYAAYLWSMLITAGTMVVVTLFLGWERRGAILHREPGGWLEASQAEARKLQAVEPESGGWTLPALLGLLVTAAGLLLSFVIFW